MRALALSRLRMARREWWPEPGKRGVSRHPLVFLILSVGLAVFVHAGLSQAYASLASTGHGESARLGLLALALGGAVFALLAFDVEDVMRSLLLDPDLELLRRAPIAPAWLVAIKSIDTAPRTLPPVLALALPAATSFLAGSRAPWPGAMVAVAALALLWIAALAAGLALSLLLLRLAPARLAREAVALVATLALTLLWIAGAMLLPRALESGADTGRQIADMLSAAATGAGPAAAAARAIGAASGPAAGASVALELAALLGFALAAIGLLAVAIRFALATVLARVASDRTFAPPGFAAAPKTHRWRGGGVLAAIVRRDGRLLARSWTLIADLGMGALMWGGIPLATLAGGALSSGEVVRLVLFSLAIGLGYEVAARAVPFERHAFFWARVGPVNPLRYVLGKLVGSAAVSVPMVGVVSLGLLASPLALGIDRAGTVGIVVGALLLSQAIGLWAGITWGDRDWVNPRAMLRLGGRLMASLLGLVQFGFWFAFAFFTSQLDGDALAPLALAGPVILAAAIAILPIGAAARRLGEPDSGN